MKQIVTIALIATVGIFRISFGGELENRTLDCDSTFAPDITTEYLVKIFGSANVTHTQVDVGEGIRAFATVLYANVPELRAEVYWKDPESMREPRLVRVQRSASKWLTYGGLSIGTDLLTVEKVNRKPFRLAGFAWDYGGTVLSWSGGALAASTSSPCRLVVRLAPELDSSVQDSLPYRQVQGDREFSSGHPAMQALNPQIYELLLVY